MLTRSMIPEEYIEERDGVLYYVAEKRRETRPEVEEIDGRKWEVQVLTGEVTITFRRLDSLPD